MSFRPTLESLEERTLLNHGKGIHPSLLTGEIEGEGQALQVHASLRIVVDGQEVAFPQGAGTTSNGGSQIHHGDDDGSLEITSTHLSLQNLLSILEGQDGEDIVARMHHGKLTIKVNGHETEDLDNLVIHDQDTIVIIVQTSDPPPTPQSNPPPVPTSAPPPSSNQLFVQQIYHDLLGRNADSGGLAAFTTALNEGMSREQVVENIESSIEFENLKVNQLYVTFLHRQADAAGQAGFVNFLAAGGTLDGVRERILGSTEFFNLAGGTNEAFLKALYTDVLHRQIDPSGDQSWGAMLTGGASTEAVAGLVLQSGEARQDLVQDYYLAFLHRTPDSNGVAGFVNAMQHGEREEQVVAGIVGSPEYYSRV